MGNHDFRRNDASRPRRRAARALLGAGLASAGLALAACGGDAAGPPAGRSASAGDAAGDPARSYADARYVGAAACTPCHAGVHRDYRHTGMARAFHRMTPAVVEADFEKDNLFVDERTGTHYRMERRGDRFVQRQFLLDDAGREYAVQEHELVYAVGSNRHNRAYLVADGARLFQAPVCWYPDASRWDLCPGFERLNDHFAREISDDCLFCHNGHMELIPGTRNAFREPIPEGIGCERCHGPGSAHVARWTEEPDAEPRGADPTIVDPADLPREARMAVCMQCHLADARATERVWRHGRDRREFRPGMELTEVMMPFRYVQPTRHDFGLSAQADRMMLSPCYTESGGRMECLTCHDPHVSLESAEPAVRIERYRQACLACHDAGHCLGDAAAREAAGDDCVACHMRTAEPEDQRFTEFTDHWVRRRIDDDERDARTSSEIEPIFPEAFAALPQGERLYYRARANFLLAGEATLSWRPTMYARAENDFRDAIAAGFDHAESRFFLGKTLAYQNRVIEAAQQFDAALGHDPEHRDAAFALAQALAAGGEMQAALEVLARMIAERPDDAMALAEYGRVAWTQRRFSEALAAYEKAVALNPEVPEYQLNLGMVLSTVERWEEAALVAERVVALDPDSPTMWNYYFNVMRAAGRPAEERLGRVRLQRLTGDGSP